MGSKTLSEWSEAAFSKCRNYRYDLRRYFPEGKGIVNFIMLNPSTADERTNDPTITKCEHYATTWGYKGLVVTNLLAYRATDPKLLLTHLDKATDSKHLGLNFEFIFKHIMRSDLIVCAWGNHGSLKIESLATDLDLGTYVAHRLAQSQDLSYLKMNKTGHPAHPLYLRKDLKPQSWNLDQNTPLPIF